MNAPEDKPRTNHERRPRVRHETVGPDRAGQRLDNYLGSELKGLPRSAIYRMIRTGQVRVNGGRARPNSRLETGDEVRIPPARLPDGSPPRVPDRVCRDLEQRIIYDDGSLLVLDKPAGIAVHAGSGLAWGVIEALRQARPGESLELAHRLDRYTSGCLALARDRGTLLSVQQQMGSGAARKFYLCLLDGDLGAECREAEWPLTKVRRGGEWRVVVDPAGKPAHTTFRRLEQLGPATFTEAELHTGRTHQVRVHAAELGAPLAGDDRYAAEDRRSWWKQRGLGRVFLHAHRLELDTPASGPLLVEAPLPDDLRAVLDGLVSDR